jgi:hypothetical protein
MVYRVDQGAVPEAMVDHHRQLVPAGQVILLLQHQYKATAAEPELILLALYQD